jgi:hypothetical protein
MFFAEGDDGSVTFHEATHLTADDVLRLFQRRGLLDKHTAEDMLTWQASGGFSLEASFGNMAPMPPGASACCVTAPDHPSSAGHRSAASRKVVRRSYERAGAADQQQGEDQ